MTRLTSIKTCISKPALAAFPEPVRDAIRAYADRFAIKSLTFVTVDPKHTWWAGEGEHYTLIYGAETQSVETVAEHNVGARYVLYEAIGTTFSAPVGAWVVEVYYYGKFFMTVFNVQSDRLTAEVSQ